MTPSQICLDLIKSAEGYRAMAYLDSVGIPTIGYGTIMYDTGARVKIGDAITEDRAQMLLRWDLNLKVAAINGLTSRVNLNQNQFDALCSLTYNIGLRAFSASTLLKKLRVYPGNPSIHDEFLRWNKADGRVIDGLTNRRIKEAELYFTPMA